MRADADRRRELDAGHFVRALHGDLEIIVGIFLRHDGNHSWHRHKPRPQARQRLFALDVHRSVSRVGVEARVDDPVGLDRTRHLTHAFDHIQEQRAHCQQRRLRERDLRDDQGGRQARARRRHRPGGVFEHVRQRQARGVQRRREAEQDAGSKRQSAGEDEAAHVDRDVQIRNGRLEHPQQDPDDEQAQRCPAKREHCALRHQLPNEPAARSAECETHGHLPPPRDGQARLQRADRGARDR